MFQPKARVLLILPQAAVDRARALSGRLTAALRLPVSLQIVFRVLIEDGLARAQDGAFLAKVERHVREVRRARREARAGSRGRGAVAQGSAATRSPGTGRPARQRGR